LLAERSTASHKEVSGRGQRRGTPESGSGGGVHAATTALTADQARRAEWALAAAEAKLRRPALQDAGELLELVRRGLQEQAEERQLHAASHRGAQRFGTMCAKFRSIDGLQRQ